MILTPSKLAHHHHSYTSAATTLDDSRANQHLPRSYIDNWAGTRIAPKIRVTYYSHIRCRSVEDEEEVTAEVVAASHREVVEVALAVEDVVDMPTLALPRQCSPWVPSFTPLRARCFANRPMLSTSHTSMLLSSTYIWRRFNSTLRIIREALSAPLACLSLLLFADFMLTFTYNFLL